MAGETCFLKVVRVNLVDGKVTTEIVPLNTAHIFAMEERKGEPGMFTIDGEMMILNGAALTRYKKEVEKEGSKLPHTVITSASVIARDEMNSILSNPNQIRHLQ